MAEGSITTAQIRAWLVEEEARKADSEAKIAALKLTLAMADERSGSLPQAESVTPAPPAILTPPPPPVVTTVSMSGRFFGLSKPDACVKLLKETDHPLTPLEMGETLVAEGFPITHEDRAKGIRWALKKRAEKVGDVVLVGLGQWGLREWYTDDELELLKRGRGGMGGRDRKTHSARTKAGMAALRENGVTLGRTEKMTPQVMGTIEQMLLAQRKVADIASELGVSKASIYGRFTVGRVNGRQTVERRDVAGNPPLRLVVR
jgi:hypothetical protein